MGLANSKVSDHPNWDGSRISHGGDEKRETQKGKFVVSLRVNGHVVAKKKG